MQKVIYDGTLQCGIGSCPIVSLDEDAGTVTIADQGECVMGIAAYNRMLAEAKPIPGPVTGD